jgi:hypothetical protein
MKTIFSTIAILAWALWLGGAIALFLFVTMLFKTDRELAREAAPVLFKAFEVYQTSLAGAAVIASGGWLLSGRSWAKVTVFILLLLAGGAALALPRLFTAEMEKLRLAGRSDSPEFRKLHGWSSAVYSAEAAILGMAGLLLPLAIRKDRDHQNTPRAAATDIA